MLSHSSIFRSLCSCNKELPTVPQTKLITYEERVFSTEAPGLRNELSLSIKKSPFYSYFLEEFKNLSFQRSLSLLPFILDV